MRILFVISDLLYGGAQTQLIGLACELVRRQHDVAIYTLNRNNPRAAELVAGNVELVADQKRSVVDLGVLRRLRRFIRTWRADVVHGFLYDGDFYSRLAAFGTQVPALNSERSDNYRLNNNQRIGHLLTRRMADGVVANSHAGAAFAQKLFRLPVTRVHVVWNGIDPAKIDARVAENEVDYRQLFFDREDVRIACCVGNIRPEKDYLLALAVADSLTRAHSDWRVLFVGEQFDTTADYKAEVMRRWQRLGLQDRAIFCGLRTDAVEIIAQSDVLFSTSVCEGFPNVVLEAMTVGTPAVSTVYSDIQRILPNPWQVVPERSAEALVGAIMHAYRERKEVQALQRAWVERYATFTAAANALLQVYGMYIKKEA